MVRCRRPFVEIERDGLRIEGGDLSPFEYTDAPVDIGREAVAQVVVRSDAALSYEGLMADEHPRAEALPVQLVWWAKPSESEVLILGINETGITIEHIGEGGPTAGSTYQLFDSSGGGESIASIDVPYIVSRSTVKSLIHRIVDALIWLAVDFGLRSKVVHQLQRVVLGCAIDDKVLDMRIGLCRDAAQGARDGHRCIVADGDDGDVWLHHLMEEIRAD